MLKVHPDPLKPLDYVTDEATFKYVMTHCPDVFIAYYGGLEVEPYQRQFLTQAHEEMRSLILLPARHGKSTLLSKWLPIWEMCINPNIRIILIMKTKDDVKAYANGIMNILQSNTKLIRDFGPFYNRDNVWSTSFFNIAKRQIMDEHLTLEFFGAGGKVLGHRSDLVIVDDVVTDDTGGTPERRREQLRWFREEVQTSPGLIFPRDEETGKPEIPEGISWPTDVSYERIVVAGTRFHPQDLYFTLERDSTYKKLYFDCFWNHETHTSDPTQTSALWPRHMPVKELKREIKSLGILSFNKRFRNIAFDEAEMAFPEVYIRGGEYDGVTYDGCLDRSRSFGDYDDEWFISLGFDPASGSTSKQSTYPSYIVLGTDNSVDPPKRYIVDLFRKQMPVEDIISVLLDGDEGRGLPGFYDLYHYDVGKIEVNAVQKWLLQHQRVKDALLQGIRLEPHQTSGNKWDPTMGVKSMAAMFANSNISIPYKTAHDRAKAGEFINQLVMFPKGVYDFCMALWFAELAARDAQTKYEGYYLAGHSGRFRTNPYWGDVVEGHEDNLTRI